MAQIPPGSYEQTSRNIVFTGTPGKTDCFLSAECQKPSGEWVKSELKYDIANCGGQLKWAPNGC